MSYKLYRATDKLDNEDSAFLVYPDGGVAVSSWNFSAEEKIELAKNLAHLYSVSRPQRFDAAINPILIAEW